MIPSAIRDLLRPPPGMEVDFTSPRGAEALVPADGISWKIFANPVSLFIGGVGAVLLELAEPSVRAGVWEHSSFRKDPVTRLHRTGYAALVTVYAPREQAQQMIARVVSMHERVTGATPDGLVYRANDPRLLRWVHATALWGFAEAYHRYVTPLSDTQRSQAFAEGQQAARLYGVLDPPDHWADWEKLLQDTAPGLEDSATIAEFLELIENAPLLPTGLRPFQRLLVRAAVDMTPLPVAGFASLQTRQLTNREARLVRLLGRTAGRVRLPGLPFAAAEKRVSYSAAAKG